MTVPPSPSRPPSPSPSGERAASGAHGPEPIVAISVNGETHEIAGGSHVASLLATLSLAGKRVAVARNGDVVPRSRYAETPIVEGDRIEILEAVGGG